jgi:two-component system LytT family sensor kinase
LSFWQFQLIGWSCFYVLTMVAAAPYLKEPHVFVANSIWVLVLFGASWLLRPACSYSLKKHRPWFIHEIHALAFALILSALTVVLVDVIIFRDQPNDWSGLPLDFVQNGVVLFLWCNVYYAATQWQEMSQQRERMLRAESQLREAKLNALRFQLNPHFLFNSLNAVSTLVLDHDSERATRMLSCIGTLLRRTLEEESIAEIPLAQELEFTNQYLEVEQIRLGERLRVTTDVSPDTLEAVVPVMLLQPLVENAVIHGIAPQVSGGDLLIRSVIVDSRLELTVRNSGVRRNGEPVNEHGIGLKNCIERLKTIYGTDYRLELNWPNEGGCEVKLDLPFPPVRN